MKKPTPLKVARLAAGWIVCGCLSGCGLLGGFTHPKAASPVVPVRPQPDLRATAPLLELMNALPQGDPGAQAELFQSAKDAAALSPTTSNRLKFALALATPAHSGSDPVAAQRQLSELLARPETLLTVERLLAQVELREVEQRLVLQAENRRLRDEISHDSRDKLQAVNRRLALESDENARLRKALDEARAKLEAVTHIDRSINDRGTGGPRKP